MATFQAVIFDLGKVIFDLSFDRVFQSWAASSGREFDDIKRKFMFDELYDTFERNEIAAEEYRAAVSRRLDIRLSDEDFDRGWCDLYLDVYEDIDDILVRLKPDYKLVALTNTNILHHNVWSVRYADTLRHFEKVFSSHEIGVRKPEEKSFEIVLNYVQWKPIETIFLDDSADNITGADKLGMATILVTSPTRMKEELRRHGLLQ